MYTIGDLKRDLAELDDSIPLVMQEDDEGNGYHYVRGVEFIPSGEHANYYDPKSRECLTGQDLEYYERDPKEEGLKLCAVVF
jgi:hypothetical protein